MTPATSTGETPPLLSRRAGRLIVAVAATALLAFRKWGALVHPRFWAEDGLLFFLDSDTHAGHGWGDLLAPYQGYLHLVPRVIAAAGHALPLAWIPAWYAWTSLAATGVVLWSLQSPRVRLPAARCAAIAVAAMPHSDGEVYLAICNLQWILAIGLMAILISDDARGAAPRTLEGAGLAIAGLTGPYIVLLLPFFVVRAAFRRTGWSIGLASIAAACCAVQAPAVLAHFHEPAAIAQPARLIQGAEVAARRVVVSLLAGAADPSPAATLAIAVAALAGLAWAVWIRRAELPGAATLAAGAAVILAAGTFKSRLDRLDYSDLVNGDRYYFIPKVVLIWVLAAVAVKSRGFVRGALACLLVAPLVANRGLLVFPRRGPSDWARAAARIDAGQPVEVPILPDGLTLRHPGRAPR